MRGWVPAYWKKFTRVSNIHRMDTAMRRYLLVCLLVLGVSATGCTDSAQRAREAQRVFRPQPAIPLPEGSRPNAVTIADANGDGAPDLLIACTGKAGVCVLLGDGKGKFSAAPGSPFSATTAPHLIATGDFNGDKKLDVIVTSHDSNGAYLLTGDGKGGFALTVNSPFIAFPLGKAHNHGLVVGDMNGDGNTDITMGHQDQGAIAVLLGDGKEGFTPAPGSPFKLGRGFYPHALADLNGDGKLDAVAPDVMGAAIVVAMGDGKGGLRTEHTYRVRTRPFHITLHDVNGDGKLDVAATHDDIHDVDVMLGDGLGNFTAAHGSPLDSGFQGWKIAASDVDGDGHQDLIIGGGDGFHVYAGDGTGQFTAKPENVYTEAGAAWGMAAGDVNKDGKVDVVIVEAEKNIVSVFLRR